MIPYGRHTISQADIDRVSNVLYSEWLTLGPEVSRFEEAISHQINSECFVVSSGTAALHCAYAAIAIQPGDEIITPPLTYIATQSTAMHFGAKIVFCDVSEFTGLIDPSKVEGLITSRTKAITVVDFAGHPGHMDELRAICDKHGLYLIEDASHSLGSTYKSKPVGSLADLTTFSFFPTKNITTAEGGAVSGKDSTLLDRARKFGRQGMIKDRNRFVNEMDGPWHQEVHNIGLNYRLPDVLAALGSSQIERLKEFKKIRKLIFNYYKSNLSGNPFLTLPGVEPYVEPNWHLYPLRVPRELRKSLYEHLWANDILVQVNYVPAYFHPILSDLGYKRGLCPIAEDYYWREISLPIHPNVSEGNLEMIVSKIDEFFRFA